MTQVVSLSGKRADQNGSTGKSVTSASVYMHIPPAWSKRSIVQLSVFSCIVLMLKLIMICILLPFTFHPSTRNKRGMSANAEDVTIYDAFFSSDSFRGENHTYMEIGAHDGVRESNSRFFDICLGWNGLLVEPHPKNYDRTVRLRPNAHHLGIAPSCTANESGTILFPEHMYTSAQVNEKGSKIEIHCGPLQYYLDALEIRHIDFWSLDVEGSELKVLETVDFDRTHVDVIIAESQNRLSYLPEIQKKVEDVRLLLQNRGYLMINSVVVTKSDVFLHKRACPSHGNIKECNAVSR